jgi:hypothetical protein
MRFENKSVIITGARKRAIEASARIHPERLFSGKVWFVA